MYIKDYVFTLNGLNRSSSWIIYWLFPNSEIDKYYINNLLYSI